MSNLSFVTPLAYDYRYAFRTIQSYYEIADEIILGLDKDRISWAGNPFQINLDELNAFIQKVDLNNKIRIIEDDFHCFASSKQNDTRERNFLSKMCKKGNWIVQIDSDEILINPIEFSQWMKTVSDRFLVQASWQIVFKVFPNEGICLLVDGDEFSPNIATKKSDSYISHRRTKQKAIKSPLVLLHFSWGRSREELAQKMTNWSHNTGFNKEEFLAFWDSVDMSNFQKFKNFHPIDGYSWPSLRAVRLSELGI